MSQESVHVEPPAAPRTSGLAITALVLSCLVLPPFSLVGLVLGIVALLRINAAKGALRGSALAVAAVTVGAASMVISCCLAAMLVPALTKAREQARSVACRSNLKQIGLAMDMYRLDHNALPPDLQALLDGRYVIEALLFQCPAARDASVDPARVDDTGSYIYAPLSDAAGSKAVPIVWDRYLRHGAGGNVLLSDRTVMYIAERELLAAIEENADLYVSPPSPPVELPEP